MKKLAMGCGILAILLVAGGAVGSYLVYHKVKSAVGGFAELRTVPELERSVRNRSPYVPAPSGEVSSAQLQRVLEIQKAVRTRLGARGAEMERKYRTLLAKKEATALDMPELVAAYSDLAAGYVDGKRAQVDALNRTGLSLEEYRWVRKQSYAALGLPMMDLDVAAMIEDVRNGRTPPQPTRVLPLGPSGPPANQKLVGSHRKELEDYAPLAFFGL
ncbi:MAG: hypothetical protein ACM3NS_03215 [Deltaproteobacteria bacterium]